MHYLWGKYYKNPLVAQTGDYKNPLVAADRICLQCRRRRFNPWVRKIP